MSERISSNVFSLRSFHYDVQKTIWSPAIIYSTIMMIAAGSINTLGFKIQSDVCGFKHGAIQTSLMFIGEYINLFLYNARLAVSSKKRKKHFEDLHEHSKDNNTTFEYSILWMGLASFLDSQSSTMNILALLLMPASINQMLYGGNVISTCLISRALLKRPIYRHNALGCCFA